MKKASNIRGDKSTVNRHEPFARIDHTKTISIPVLLCDFTISSSCKYLSVSAWTQSVDRKAGPTFLSMSRILMSGLEFSSWRSSRSCFERLFLQCEFQPRSSFATLREAWRVCPQDLGFPSMESSRLERIILGWNRCFEVGWQTYLEGELFGKSLEFAGWTEELLKGARKVWTSDLVPEL